MSQTEPPSPTSHRLFSPLGGVLSYLVPGLGQIMQGRVAKGLLFFVCLYTLFFYGQYLGQWQNVYIQQSATKNGAGSGKMVEVIIERARFAGQFFIGTAAWPAVWQWYTYNRDEAGHPVLGKFQREPKEDELNDQLRNTDKNPDLGVMYTIIAGVLNILVIYDAFAGPAMGSGHRSPRTKASEPEGAVT